MVTIKKNEKYTVEITDYTEEGLGVGKVKMADGESFFPLFIKNTAVGDKVVAEVIKVKKTYGYGRIIEILSPSSDRKDPDCVVFGKCGGCQLRHIRYEAQLQWKEKRVSDVMERVGGVKAGVDYEFLPIIGMDDTVRYRNKAQYPVGSKDGMTVTGFYAGRTHAIIPTNDCMIEHEGNADILRRIRCFWDSNKLSVYKEESGSGILRHILIRTAFASKETMVCLVVNLKDDDKKYLKEFNSLGEELKKINNNISSFILNFNNKKTNVILGDKEQVIFGKGFITDYISDLRFRVSAGSFFQVNPVQTVKLYEKALEFAGLTGKENVWDLYCGTGTISLFLAKKAGFVYGVESFEKAVEDAKINAEDNGIKNVRFICSKAEEIKIGEDISRPDLIVVDPPRKGCDERLLETIANSDAKRLVYVSCNPATLARDTAILSRSGIFLKRLLPVDMFPETTGVENVAFFEKNLKIF